MKSSWTLGLNEKEAEEIESIFKANARLRERAIAILQKRIDTSHTARNKKDSYEKASWPYLQADACGYERAMQEIIDLLSA